MKCRLMAIIGSLLLSGCVTTTVDEAIPVSQRTSHSVFELQRTTLSVPSTATIEINQHTQYLKSRFIDSPVAAFNIPADSGTIDIKISSTVQGSVFYPSAVILSAQGSILQSFNSADFKYALPQFGLAGHLVADKTFRPPYDSAQVYLVVYTQKSALKNYTNIVNPKYLEAKAKGTTLPEKQTIQIPHSDEGVITVNIENSNASVSHYNRAPQPSALAPAPEPQSVLSKSEYYRVAIQAAVDANNVPRALDLVKEAKAQNIEGMEQVFVNAVQHRN